MNGDNQLLHLIDEFLNGVDTSREQADRIVEFILEHSLDQRAPNDEVMTCLTQYDPESTEPEIYGGDELMGKLRYFREQLRGHDG